jgi:diguanylate cyclase (GGDEF)-like protein
VGLFGLDPITYQLLRPGPAMAVSLSRGRLWFLGIAVATIPVAMGVSALIGRQVNGALLVFGGGLVTAIVMTRIRWLSAERLRAEDALRVLASHDPLTGLVNRREFMARLNDQQSRTPQDVMLFCDLDRFKEVNDRFGHSAGDQLLVEVAHRLEASIRETDTVARLGGDEFIILLTSARPSEVESILQRISDVLSQPITVSGQQVGVQASIGVVSADGAEPEELLKRADHAMYNAKQSEPAQRGVRIVSG